MAACKIARLPFAATEPVQDSYFPRGGQWQLFTRLGIEWRGLSAATALSSGPGFTQCSPGSSSCLSTCRHGDEGGNGRAFVSNRLSLGTHFEHHYSGLTPHAVATIVLLRRCDYRAPGIFYERYVIAVHKMNTLVYADTTDEQSSAAFNRKHHATDVISFGVYSGIATAFLCCQQRPCGPDEMIHWYS